MRILSLMEDVMKDIEIKNVKGTFDYLPKEQKIRDYVTDILKDVFESFSYMPVVTLSVQTKIT